MFAAVVLVLGCHRATEATIATDASSAPPPPAAPSASCASIVGSYDSLVAAGGACTGDGDCECFAGGVSPKSACGGVTDHATAAKLEKLRAEYESLGSCNAFSCAATLCKPACVSSACVNAAAVATAPPAPAPSATSWTSCRTDADCTYVSLGCCDTTPVNRAHRADAQRKLDRSGHTFCPPISACGPGADGTWAGTPGKCAAGSCVLR